MQKIKIIDHRVLSNPQSDIADVNKYLAHVSRRNDSAKLSALWDEAHPDWKPVVAKFWGKLNEGKNLFMVKVEKGQAQLPESNETIVQVGDNIENETSDDPDAVVDQDTVEIDDGGVEDLTVIQKASAVARKKVHGNKK